MNQRQLFFIVIFMCFNVLQSFSQASNKSYQLIIEVPTFTVEKTLPYLLNQLSGTTGVKISEYCADQGWIVFDIHEERFSVAQDPLVLLKELQIEGILKLGASKNQVEANCKGGLHVLDIKK